MKRAAKKVQFHFSRDINKYTLIGTLGHTSSENVLWRRKIRSCFTTMFVLLFLSWVLLVTDAATLQVVIPLVHSRKTILRSLRAYSSNETRLFPYSSWPVVELANQLQVDTAGISYTSSFLYISTIQNKFPPYLPLLSVVIIIRFFESCSWIRMTWK